MTARKKGNLDSNTIGGGIYKIITIAKDCDTQAIIVVYATGYHDSHVWTRSLNDFMSLVPDVDANKSQRYRFTRKKF